MNHTSDPEPLAQSWSRMGVVTDLQAARATLERARDRAAGAVDRLPLAFLEKIAVVIGVVEALEAEMEDG